MLLALMSRLMMEALSHVQWVHGGSRAAHEREVVVEISRA
jgi:hypothetical protein